MSDTPFAGKDFVGKEFMENTPEGRPPRAWDFFLTIFLIFMLLVLTVIFEVLAIGLAVTTITCADSSVACNYTFISAGSLVAIIGIPVVALTGIVLSIVWIARRKVSFVMPLIASLLVVGLYLLGAWVVDLAVPGA
ncbi:MAG: hypothetical protein ABI632_04230 [Pseudolysinimonas sp.]